MFKKTIKQKDTAKSKKFATNHIKITSNKTLNIYNKIEKNRGIISYVYQLDTQLNKQGNEGTRCQSRINFCTKLSVIYVHFIRVINNFDTK